MAIGSFLNLIIQILVIAGGLYALINLILAGYQFMSSAGDSKGTAAAWAKIWQTLLGLAFITGSTVLAAIFGKLLFGDWAFLLRPTLVIP